MRTTLALLCALGTAACADNTSETSAGSTSTGNSDPSSADTPPDTPTTTFMLECTPGQERCADENTREVCNATGFGWDATPCTQYQKCQESSDDGPMVAICEGPCELLKETSIGCEFYAIRMRSANQSDSEEDSDAIMVGNTDKDKTALVSLYLVPNYFTIQEDLVEGPIELAPGQSHVFTLTNDTLPGYSTIRDGGVYHVVSDYPVSAYLHSPLANSDSNDASMLLPVKALGTDYIVPSYPGWVVDPDNTEFSYGRPSYFNVIVTEDDTEIKWTPPQPTHGDNFLTKRVEKGETGTVTLNRFNVLQIGAASVDEPTGVQFHDVSGTIIRANKPIVVMGATACARVPYDSAGGCNHLQEQVLPYKYWGTSYIAAHAPFRSGTEKFHWRVYAGASDQNFSVDPPNAAVPPFKLNNVGDFKDIAIDVNPKSFAFKSSKPFLAVQYLAGGKEAGNIGDPAMFQSIPIAQFLKRYVFVTGKNYTQNFAQFIRKKNGPPVFIDSDPNDDTPPQEVGPWELVNVSGEGGALSAEVCDWALDASLEAKAYIAESDGEFGVNVIGYVENSAYAYPAGMALKELNPDSIGD